MVEVTGQKTGRMNYEKPKLVELCPKERSEDLIEGVPEGDCTSGTGAGCSKGTIA